MIEKAHHLDVVAIRKSGIEGWEPFKYVHAVGGMLLTGGIPTILTRGPRKGSKTWKGPTTTVVITREEVDAEEARYALTTGNCGACYGEGKRFAGWSQAEGKKYRPCDKCNATGRATPTKSDNEDAVSA